MDLLSTEVPAKRTALPRELLELFDALLDMALVSLRFRGIIQSFIHNCCRSEIIALVDFSRQIRFGAHSQSGKIWPGSNLNRGYPPPPYPSKALLGAGSANVTAQNLDVKELRYQNLENKELMRS